IRSAQVWPFSALMEFWRSTGKQTPPSDLSMESSMLIRLCSDSLFKLADSLLNFSGILFSSAISFQVGLLGKLAGLLLDCAFDFVKLACCLIFGAGFHHDYLLGLVVGFQLVEIH